MLRVEPAVKQTTKVIAMGTAVLCVLMLAVFIGIRQFDWTVLLGTVLGGSLAVLNFFLLALGVQKAAKKAPETASPVSSDDPEANDATADHDEPEEEPVTEEQAKARKAVRQTVQSSYYLRMALIIAVLAGGILLPCFNTVATIVPLLFPRIVIMIQGLVSARKENRS